MENIDCNMTICAECFNCNRSSNNDSDHISDNMIAEKEREVFLDLMTNQPKSPTFIAFEHMRQTSKDGRL